MVAEKKRIAEEKEAKEKAEQQKQCEQFMFLRLVKQLLKQNKQVETLRELLFSHKFFNLQDTFKHFDADASGVLDAEKIADGFAPFNINYLDLESLETLVVEIVDDDNDGTVDLREFTEAVTPKSGDYAHGGKGNMAHLNVEQKKVMQQAHMESLAELFSAICDANSEFIKNREKLQLDGESIFDQIDSYKMGYISTVSLANWVNDNCGFKISPQEMPALQRRFDRHDKYRITKEAFIAALSPAPEEDEEADE